MGRVGQRKWSSRLTDSLCPSRPSLQSLSVTATSAAEAHGPPPDVHRVGPASLVAPDSEFLFWGTRVRRCSRGTPRRMFWRIFYCTKYCPAVGCLPGLAYSLCEERGSWDLLRPSLLLPEPGHHPQGGRCAPLHPWGCWVQKPPKNLLPTGR